MKRILITGHKGFIGKYLTKYFSQDNHVFTIPKKAFNSSNALRAKLDSYKCDYLIHLASYTSLPEENYEYYNKQLKNTLLPTINLALNAPKATKVIIFFGSSDEYGNSKIPYKENTLPNPLTSYGWAKYSARLAVKKIMEERKIPYIWVIPGLVIAEHGNPQRLSGEIFSHLKNNKKLKVRNPDNIRDFITMDNLASIIDDIKDNKKLYNSTTNISFENYFNIKNLYEHISENKKLIKVPKASFVGRPGRELMFLSGSKLKKIIRKKIKNNINEYLKSLIKRFKKQK
jgi:nucleoside-diphosphate-sugar epimerase